MNRSNEEDIEKAKSLISIGAEIAGAAVGGAIGFFATGPVGAAGAGFVRGDCRESWCKTSR